MSKQISDYEMRRRQFLESAKDKLLEAIGKIPHELTVMEWLEVLSDIQQWLISQGLAEERRNHRP